MTKCPNCDATVKPGAKFCTHCGFDLTKATPKSTQSTSAATDTGVPDSAQTQENTNSTTQEQTQVNRREQVQRLQFTAKSYFNWLLQTWKTPTTNIAGESYFAYLSFVIEALLVTTTAVTLVNRFLTAFNRSQSAMNASKLTFGTDLKILLVVLLGMVFYLGVGFAVSTLGNRGIKIGLSAYLAQFARLTNAAMIVNLLLLVSVFMVNMTGNIFQLWGSLKLVFVLFSLGCLIWQLGLILSITSVTDQPVISKAYLVLIAVVIVSVLSYLMTRLISQDIATEMISKANDLMTQFSSLFEMFGRR
ncbi:zinc ribbon domain-containing protein [Lactiplantibacillus sp. WILCCON 0030]|uniref:Zinc ribbon domain-containing protein n=1 Tax=Lactiplantibacillus brownii TaxID=3069269 RepID=A0ABU1A9E0_9LACO|nr:zinc ribbon domain-containing protein [Lactiplantibacillus brownii]MDQ7936980.1 zinc ribbon domain-containing protein [Lactiplantibacillus brownii]